MSKITGKFQITLPKKLAETYGLKVGDEVEFVAAGDTIAIVPPLRAATLTLEERLQRFDEATRRQRARQRGRSYHVPPKDRGWTREELYTRGRAR